MSTTAERVEEFFERYAAALLARDAGAVAVLYAVPALILFPGNSVPVASRNQTEQFFAASWVQYEGVESVEKRVRILEQAPWSVWADVAWSYGGGPRERFCYQLIDDAGQYRIAVLTPLP
jgi:ketosteroid isomerase-like protein